MRVASRAVRKPVHDAHIAYHPPAACVSASLSTEQRDVVAGARALATDTYREHHLAASCAVVLPTAAYMLVAKAPLHGGAVAAVAGAWAVAHVVAEFGGIDTGDQRARAYIDACASRLQCDDAARAAMHAQFTTDARRDTYVFRVVGSAWTGAMVLFWTAALLNAGH